MPGHVHASTRGRCAWSHTGCDASGWCRDAFEHENRASLADTDPAPEPEEDLDQLFAQYEQQAEADKSKVATAAIVENFASQKSMKELRESGLSQPIGQDTK